jgi:ATP-binding cassette subfamily B protein RaxB
MRFLNLKEVFLKGLSVQKKIYHKPNDLKESGSIYIHHEKHYWELCNQEEGVLEIRSANDAQKQILPHHLQGQELVIVSKNESYPVDKGILKYFFKSIFQAKKFSLFIFSLILFYGLSYLLEPLFLNLVLGQIYFFNHLLDWLLPFSIAGFGILLSLKTEYYLQKFSVFYLGNIALNLAKDFLQKYLIQDKFFLYQQKPNETYTRLYACEQVFYRMLQQLFNILNDILFFIINLFLMFWFSWQLTCIELVFLGFMALVHVYYLNAYFKQSKQVLEQQQSHLSFLLELFKNLISLKLYAKEWVFWNRWQVGIRDYWQVFLKNDFFQQKLMLLNEFLKKTNTLIVLGLAIDLIHTHCISATSFLIFLFLKTQVYLRFEGVFKRLMQWHYLKSPIARMKDLITTTLTPSKVLSQNDMQLKNLMYLPNKSINQHFIAGKKYFIKGPSGCGKTTLLNCLLGLKMPLQGEVVFADAAYAILQTDALWQGSILENITFFEKEIDETFLEQVIDTVDIKIPLSTAINQLSAGEQQRVLLARALYTHPKWLILDEATCHLDEVSEQKIIDKLLALPVGMLMVSHNPNLAQGFDECVELH